MTSMNSCDKNCVLYTSINSNSSVSCLSSEAPCPHSPQERSGSIDMLDRVVHVIAFGDLEAEDVLQLTELNFMKVFRLAQLSIEYLMYGQDMLAADCARLRHERSEIW